jgi:hypothetical protein
MKHEFRSTKQIQITKKTKFETSPTTDLPDLHGFFLATKARREEGTKNLELKTQSHSLKLKMNNPRAMNRTLPS